MGFILPGFPEEVSEKIELPNIAELLTYPMFHNASPEAVRKYGTEFQKSLLDKIPWKNDMKHQTILFYVQFLQKNTRSMTSYNRKIGGVEWHIDGLGEDDYQKPSERVHLLLGECTALTEFNAKPVDFSYLPDDLPKTNFTQILHNHIDKLGIETKSVEPGRIVSFQNHLHRAKDPDSMEFRFVMRARETNRPEGAHAIENAVINEVEIFDTDLLQRVPNIRMDRDGIKIFFKREVL